MAKTRIYFVSDLHGSNVCFRKFINAAKVYEPKVLILGGDVDRQSKRLHSSHANNSSAVFCFRKNNHIHMSSPHMQ